MDCVADTHALVWYLYAMLELSADAKTYMDNVAASGGYIFVPTISLVEITYLAEKNRLGANVLPRISAAIQTANSVLKNNRTDTPNYHFTFSNFAPDRSRNARPHNCRNRFAFEPAAGNEGSQYSSPAKYYYYLVKRFSLLRQAALLTLARSAEIYI